MPRAQVEHCVLTPEVVTVIQGVRRCGKSTLLRQLMAANRIAEDRAVFIYFEDPRLVNDLDSALLERIYQSPPLQLQAEGGAIRGDTGFLSASPMAPMRHLIHF